VAAPEPSLVGKRSPEPRGTWRHWSPPQPRGEVRSRRTHDSVEAQLDREVRSEATEHVAVSELSSAGRRGPSVGSKIPTRGG
jgi:hypothetical protein